MSGQARMEALDKEIDRILRTINGQVGSLHDLIAMLKEFTAGIEPTDYVAGADFDGSLNDIRRDAGFLWGETIQMTDKVKEVARDFRDSISGAVQSLQEPDRSDEEWEERHAEHLGLMAEYEDALNEAHRRFVKMQKHYERYIRSYRDKALAD